MRLTQRLTGRYAALLAVDMQDKLLKLIPDHERVVANLVALIRGARRSICRPGLRSSIRAALAALPRRSPS